MHDSSTNHTRPYSPIQPQQSQDLKQPGSTIPATVQGAGRSLLQNLGLALWRVLKPTNEPIVRRRMDAAGNLWWQVHNPATGAFAEFDSEADVRIWLERQYYS